MWRATYFAAAVLFLGSGAWGAPATRPSTGPASRPVVKPVAIIRAASSLPADARPSGIRWNEFSREKAFAYFAKLLTGATFEETLRIKSVSVKNFPTNIPGRNDWRVVIGLDDTLFRVGKANVSLLLDVPSQYSGTRGEVVVWSDEAFAKVAGGAKEGDGVKVWGVARGVEFLPNPSLIEDPDAIHAELRLSIQEAGVVEFKGRKLPATMPALIWEK